MYDGREGIHGTTNRYFKSKYDQSTQSTSVNHSPGQINSE